MRDYDAEAEYIDQEFQSGAIDTEDKESYLRQLDEDMAQEAREMSPESDEEV